MRICNHKTENIHFKFKVCKSLHHRTIQINIQTNATIFQFIILTSVYSSTCFPRFPAHHHELDDYSGILWFYIHIVVTVVLCLWWPRTQHSCHHNTKVKAGAAIAVIELLMMGGKTPETCWAVNKRQDNKLKNVCIWLVIYLNKF
jgi:protein-S-isoprenylcysteine O-methyltransferase Ste14